METLKDIFVSYDIAVQLKEIGFDEPCITSYNINGENQFIIEVEKYALNKKYAIGKITNSNYAGFPAPTWEQVFKWFKNKNIIFEISPIVSILNKDIKRYIFCIYDLRKETQSIKQDNIGCITYEQAREQLILKLIEIYKMNNGKS